MNKYMIYYETYGGKNSIQNYYFKGDNVLEALNNCIGFNCFCQTYRIRKIIRIQLLENSKGIDIFKDINLDEIIKTEQISLDL